MQSGRIVRLVDITAEHPPERLIELIQNRNGSIGAEEREAALNLLLDRFKGLITKVHRGLYFGEFKLHQYGYDQVDFMQEIMLEFCNLVINDFKLKEDDKDAGYAVFGHYIKNKLYWRVKSWCQKQHRKGAWGHEHSIDLSRVDQNTGRVLAQTNVGITGNRGKEDLNEIEKEVQRNIVANAFNYEGLVLDHISGDVQADIINELIDIANDKLDHRDRTIWYETFFTGKTNDEIGEMISSKLDGAPTIGRTRVAQIAKRSNDLILSEYGRRQGLKRAAL